VIGAIGDEPGEEGKGETADDAKGEDVRKEEETDMINEHCRDGNEFDGKGRHVLLL
jgi:hypothetical protein